LERASFMGPRADRPAAIRPLTGKAKGKLKAQERRAGPIVPQGKGMQRPYLRKKARRAQRRKNRREGPPLRRLEENHCGRRRWCIRNGREGPPGPARDGVKRFKLSRAPAQKGVAPRFPPPPRAISKAVYRPAGRIASRPSGTERAAEVRRKKPLSPAVGFPSVYKEKKPRPTNRPKTPARDGEKRIERNNAAARIPLAPAGPSMAGGKTERQQGRDDDPQGAVLGIPGKRRS